MWSPAQPRAGSAPGPAEREVWKQGAGEGQGLQVEEILADGPLQGGGSKVLIKEASRKYKETEEVKDGHGGECR